MNFNGKRQAEREKQELDNACPCLFINKNQPVKFLLDCGLDAAVKQSDEWGTEIKEIYCGILKKINRLFPDGIAIFFSLEEDQMCLCFFEHVRTNKVSKKKWQLYQDILFFFDDV